MKSTTGTHFLVNGYKVSYVDGLAEFHEYGVLIRVPAEEFTYAWALKMQYRLSVLKANHLLSVK